jgi:hypothetical protein
MKTRFKRTAVFTLVVFVSILYTDFTQGQDIVSASGEKGGVGYSMFGRSIVDLGDLNSKLESSGYPSMSENFFSVGGGGHSIINNKWIVGGEGHTLLGEEATHEAYKQSLTGGYGFFDLGYILFSLKDLRLYPLLGLGGGGMNLRIKEDIASVSLDNILEDPLRGVEITTGGFLMNLGGGIDYLFTFGKDEKARGGMFLGIRAGYTISTFKGKWTMDGVEISNAPETGLKGPYIRFMIGGGAIAWE